MKTVKYIVYSVLLSLILILFFSNVPIEDSEQLIENKISNEVVNETIEKHSLTDIPEYSNKPYVEINGNEPYFTEEEIVVDSFEQYDSLDQLGRCTKATACLGKDLMPTEPREQISEVKPTGWQVSKYDWIEGELLYNRCHLIAFSLAGENANRENLITGTRYMNTDGMEPFESKVANYIYKTNNHVMYRVIPIFTGDNLIADGVLMEAYSVEDKGEGIKFCVYCYNVQPGIEIDYATGANHSLEQDVVNSNYILNTSSMKFHKMSCPNIVEIKEKNKKEFYGTRAEVIEQGYTPCGYCKP